MSTNSLIYTQVRPTVLFDAGNAEHRRFAHQFLTERTWRNCPYIFALPDGYDNVFNMIVNRLALWYSQQEFASQKKVVKLHG
jgi:hypothetical protein